MDTEDVAVLESLLRGLAEALSKLLRDTQLAGEVLAAIRRRAAPAPALGGSVDDIIDDGRFVVRWNGRECPLGPTLPFRVFRHLALARNRYVPVEQLMDEVWNEQRSEGAVRSVVCLLRKRLAAAGMPELARAVEGKPGHYRLSTDRLLTSRGSNADRTEIKRRSNDRRA